MPAPKPVDLHLDARAELQESVHFYRQRGGEALAERFKQEVAGALNAIAAQPARYSPCQDLPSARRIRLAKFPFSIIYIERPDSLWVVAVAHGSRRPGYWLSRLQE